MPILDPSLQNSLLNEITGGDTTEIEFFKVYLAMASKSIYNNHNSILSSLQFRKDVKKCLSTFCDSFKIDIPLDMEMDMPDCYKFLHQKLQSKKLKNPQKIELANNLNDYIMFKSGDNEFKYFKILSNYCRTWFINDCNTAILCLRMNSNQKNAYDLIPLEIDLLSAVGYTLVLCANGFSNTKKFNTFYEILEDHRFSEIHINFDFIDKSEQNNGFTRMIEKICSNSDHFDGYFYIYTQFFKKNGNQTRIFKKYKNPRISYFYFSDKIDKSLIKINGYRIDKFDYYIGTQKTLEIKVILCNIPLYNDKSVFQPNYSNKTQVVKINADHFLFTDRNQEVEVQIVNTEKKYKVNFDDLHLINPYLYSNHPMYLAKIDVDELNIINNVIEKAKSECKKSTKFKKKTCFSFLKDKKIMDSLKYILYAYKLHNPEFELRKSQVYVILKAVDFCIKKSNNTNDKQKGFVYQVATGEGKTPIITMIAAILAISKKIVHVVTSNHMLACRDFFDSYEFFKKIGLNSRVFLHQNEIYYKNNDEKNKFENLFNESDFANSLGMNIGVFDNKSKNRVIFSTLVNFESYYLYLMESFPSQVNKYYKNCSLVIDEADMILIDEITNGTILSKPMKSNGEEVLKHVYDSYKSSKKRKKSSELLEEIKKEFPKCTDIEKKDIEGMYKEIEMIESNSNFVNGARYSIESVKKKVDKKEVDIKEIIPVSCDKTGVLEKNKEFSGFLQQFIGLKEKYINDIKKKDAESDIDSKKEDNLKIKEISMNYLYVSHPIYISLYDSVCGLTGTLGNKYDKKLIRQHYKLESKIIPRESANKLYEYPITLCNEHEDRDQEILEAIKKFQKSKNPVLVIFKQLNEINEFQKILKKVKLPNPNIYDGRDESKINIKEAGKDGSISLGTIICARGVDINAENHHLHVIVSFYTNNRRVMDQAYGRTARNKKFGTVQVICLKSEFEQGMSLISQSQIEGRLSIFKKINIEQNKFIEHFRIQRKWIFGLIEEKVKVSSANAEKMRNIPVNVNRTIAYDYKFPICMSIDTFLDIQAQKILSLYNCPNCKYSWMLFQRYVREMILESWSLLIDKLERNNEINNLSTEVTKLIQKIEVYLPNSKDKLGILETFIHIAEKTSENYKNVRDFFKEKFKLVSENENDKKGFLLSHIRLGFHPFCLRDKSGLRTGSVDTEENAQIGYIEDPELQYIQIQGKNRIVISITKSIDKLFDMIFQFFNNFIGENISMKFFLRRTLGGCEFGICYDFDIEIEEDTINAKKNRLVDAEPLFIFSIHIWSYNAFLAGVLIFLIIYLLNLARKIITKIKEAPIEAIKTALKEAAECAVGKVIDMIDSKLLEKIVDNLRKIIRKQLEKAGINEDGISALINWAVDFAIEKIEDGSDKAHDFLKEKFKFNFKFKFLKNANLDFLKKRIFRIGFLVVICAATYLMVFKSNNAIDYDRGKIADEYVNHYEEDGEFDKIANSNESAIKNEIEKMYNSK